MVKQITALALMTALTFCGTLAKTDKVSDSQISEKNVAYFDVDPEDDQSEYVEIRTAKDLYKVRSNLDGKYKLMNDIDLTEDTAEGGVYDYNGCGWRPIGAYSDYSAEPFTGVFDGQGYTIKGLRIYYTEQAENNKKTGLGLFSNNNGCIKNIRLDDVDIYGKANMPGETTIIGAVSAYNSGDIINVHVDGTITGTFGGSGVYQSVCLAGITGYNSGIVLDCSNDATLKTVGSCCVEGFVRKSYIAGIASSVFPENKGTYNTGQMGYLVNDEINGDGIVSRCVNTGLLVNDGFRSICSVMTGISIGGTVDDSFCMTDAKEYGIIQEGNSNNCYYAGTGKAQRSGKANNCYYFSGKGTAGAGWIALNDTQMQDPDSFEGFDFENVWRMSDETLYKYPQLQSIRNGITSVEIISEPTNEIVVGTELKYEGAVARVTHEDDTYEDIILTPANTTGGDTSTAGTKTVTFSYKGFTASFDIEVVPVRVKELDIVSYPNKLDYIVGQEFSAEGLEVKSIYNNGEEKTCVDYDISEVDCSKDGVKTVTISYNGKSVSFEVNYEKRRIVELAVTKQPKKTEYTRGEQFDKTGMVVKAYYNDGTERSFTDYTVSEINKCGNVKLTVSYKDLKTTVSIVVNHKWNSGKKTSDPTCTKDGNTRYECEVCGAVKNEPIASIGHKYGEPTWKWTGFTEAKAKFVCKNDTSHTKTLEAKITSKVTKEPTCTASGIRTYTATVTLNGKKYQTTKKEKIACLSHDYNVKPTWTWNGTGYATARFTCKHDSSHVKAVKGVITNKVTKQPTCTGTGVRTYTAKVTYNGKTYTTTKKAKIEAKGHSYGSPTWTWSGTTAKATFTCKRDSSHKHPLKATVTSKITKQATCTTAGSRQYTATVTFNGKTYKTTKTVKIAAKGHSYGKPTWQWDGTSSAKATFTCKRDSSHKHPLRATISSQITTYATVNAAGTRTYTATVTLNNKQYTARKTKKYYLFDKNKTGLQMYSSKVYYVKNGVVNSSFNGFAALNGTWYYMVNGVNDTYASGLHKGTINGSNKWYYVSNGKYDSSYNGFASNGDGWWYCENGTVDLSRKDIISGTVNGESGWWFVKGGKVQMINSVEKNSSGMWCIQNGKIDFDFTGIAKNSEGAWYCVNGKVDFSYNGKVNTKSYTIYEVVNGKVVNSYEDIDGEKAVFANALKHLTNALKYFKLTLEYLNGASDYYSYYIRVDLSSDWRQNVLDELRAAYNLCLPISRFADLTDAIYNAYYAMPMSVSDNYSSVYNHRLDMIKTGNILTKDVDAEIDKLCEFFGVDSD